MISTITTASISGLKAFPIFIETCIRNGFPSFNIIGLPDKIINESRDRIITAIKNSEIDFPIRKIIVNLAPAHIKKENIILDLPIAAGILSSFNILKLPDQSTKFLFLGGLSLDGTLQKINGIISILQLCKKNNILNIVLPYDNLNETQFFKGLNIFAVKSLSDLIYKINNNIYLPSNHISNKIKPVNKQYPYDMSDVKGNIRIKRAIEIAVSGMHNLLMIGPPGTGKSLLAKCIPSILPSLSFEEALETTSIYSIRGLLSDNESLIRERPFRSPHHTSSDISIIGGGRKLQCGEITLAHNGVLFFDEFPQFKSNVIQAIREPLEEQSVTISRIFGTIKFPASFLFIAAMNPCPCGYLGSNKHHCCCTLKQIKNYYQKISGPILDRIDIQIEVPEFNFLDYHTKQAENSACIQKRVQKVHNIQHMRINKNKNFYNSYLTPKEIEDIIVLDDTIIKFLKEAINQINLSPRSYYKILKVARTIADLDGESSIEIKHISEALQYRILDRKNYFKSN